MIGSLKRRNQFLSDLEEFKDKGGDRWLKNYLDEAMCQIDIAGRTGPTEPCKLLGKYENDVVTMNNIELRYDGEFRVKIMKWRTKPDGTLENRAGSWQYMDRVLIFPQSLEEGIIKDRATGELLR